jgi:CDP-diacylglycerol--glycerol-3-phosphate 3-phosphatidyltransferase
MPERGDLASVEFVGKTASGVAFMTTPRLLWYGLRMNLPNLITLSRIPLMFVIVGLMYCTFPGAASLAFWLFILAAVGDWLDGYLARKRNMVSTFGKLMDALTDKIMVLGLVIAFVEQQKIPVVLALITLCREFLVTGMRMVAASKGVIVAADKGGKSKTLAQLIALGFFLGDPMARYDWANWFHLDLNLFSNWVAAIGLAFFILGTLLAVWSGWRYIYHNRETFFAGANT